MDYTAIPADRAFSFSLSRGDAGFIHDDRRHTTTGRGLWQVKCLVRST